MIVTRRLAKYLDDWRSFPHDAAIGYRKEGIRGVWGVLAPRSVHRLVRTGHMIIYAQPVDKAPDLSPPPGVTIARVKDADWVALASLVSQRDLARFRNLVAAGRHCLIAWRGSQPIGYAWVAAELGPDVTLCRFPLPQDAAYLWDLYVLPAERCNGIGSALASARIRTARELGFREGWRMIAPSNRASLGTLRRTSGETRIVGELRFLKLFSRMFVRYTSNPALGDRGS
jgi:GNAT superfamily N-acetyltransferase